uniref:Uncharacterized protein n=1 Tax=Rhizophora mucronata TaxID=61149 RepID=A0A2P2R3B1_RHIMU
MDSGPKVLYLIQPGCFFGLQKPFSCASLYL